MLVWIIKLPLGENYLHFKYGIKSMVGVIEMEVSGYWKYNFLFLVLCLWVSVSPGLPGKKKGMT